MPQLRHVAITTHDVEKKAKFYIDVFGMKEMGKINNSGTVEPGAGLLCVLKGRGRRHVTPHRRGGDVNGGVFLS
jgi:catechol 2,3-dioxygenase-like lactoylglutathione lyase family enzyme